MSNTSRHQWISVAAYYKAEARNFVLGRELDDWLAAENDYVKVQIALYLMLAEEDGGMTLTGLQQLAKSVGVGNPEKITLKDELIQVVQNAMHHRPCFHQDVGVICIEKDCQWKAECKKLMAEWCR